MSMCMCKTTKADNSRTMIVVDASMPVALCLYGTGVLTLDGAHHGNKATRTNSNREYSEHVFTIAMNIFAMANGFVLYVIMKVEIHSHVVISFSSISIRHARTCI